MDISLLLDIMNAILQGGSHAINVLLTVAILFLFVDRKRLIKEIERKDNHIDDIVDQYKEGTEHLTDALNAMRAVLEQIRYQIK